MERGHLAADRAAHPDERRRPRVISALRRIGLPPDADEQSPASPDWTADALLFVRKQDRLLGPVRRPTLAVLTLSERSLAGHVRRHPLLTALGACAVFGAGVGINQGLREGYFLADTIVACSLRTPSWPASC